MHQEISERKRGPVFDFVVIVGLIVLLVTAEIVREKIVSDLTLFVQLGVFALVVIVCLLLYKRRINAYRYTLIIDEQHDDSTAAFEPGTLLIDSMIGDKGREVEQLQRSELCALLAPDTTTICGDIEAIPYNSTKKRRFTSKSSRDAYTLVYVKNSTRVFALFHPSDTLCDLIKKQMVV